MIPNVLTETRCHQTTQTRLAHSWETLVLSVLASDKIILPNSIDYKSS